MGFVYRRGMYFILGGQGFVGSGIVRWCERRGEEYRVISRENYASLSGGQCDVFINANGNSWKPLASRQPMQDFDSSVRSVRASLEDFTFERYLFISSCDVYPDCSSPDATREDSIIDPANQSPYGFHKSLAEACVRHAADRWLILRPGGFVGPGLKKNPVYDILTGGRLWLDPASELQFIHVDDFARTLFSLLEQGVEREVFNICGRGTIKLSEIICHSGRQVEVNSGSPRVRYEVSTASIQRLVELPGTRETVFDFISGTPQLAGRNR